MTERESMFIAAALVPIVWVLLGYFVFRPVERLCHKYLPPHIARFLTKKRGEN